MIVTKVGDGNMLKYQFATEHICKKTEIKEMLMGHYMQDSVDLRIKNKHKFGGGFQEILFEDKNFIKLMNDETIKVGKHYQPLVLLQKHIRLSSKQRKDGSLTRRMLKDIFFLDHHRKFMKKLFQKNYAIELADAPKDGIISII